jgi:hypothetical protein
MVLVAVCVVAAVVLRLVTGADGAQTVGLGPSPTTTTVPTTTTTVPTTTTTVPAPTTTTTTAPATTTLPALTQPPAPVSAAPPG